MSLFDEMMCAARFAREPELVKPWAGLGIARCHPFGIDGVEFRGVTYEPAGDDARFAAISRRQDARSRGAFAWLFGPKHARSRNSGELREWLGRERGKSSGDNALAVGEKIPERFMSLANRSEQIRQSVGCQSFSRFSRAIREAAIFFETRRRLVCGLGVDELPVVGERVCLTGFELVRAVASPCPTDRPIAGRLGPVSGRLIFPGSEENQAFHRYAAPNTVYKPRKR